MSFGGFNFNSPTTSGTLLNTSSTATSGGTLTFPTASSSVGGFNFSTPTATAVAKPLGFNFSANSPATGATPGFSLSNPTSSAAPSSSLFNFASPASSISTPSTQTLTLPTSTTASAFSFNANTASLASAPTLKLSSTPAVASTSSAPSTGFSLISKPSTTSAPSLFSSGTSAFTLTGTTTTSLTSLSATLSTATTTSSFGGSGSGGGPSLTVRQLEEKLNKWLVELKEQEERFIRQAAHVNAWDQILQNGHDQVQTLKDTLHTVKSDQSRLEAELDFIRGQQEELERLLDPLETAVSATPATQLHQGDRQRDNMYHLALTLDGQLRQMTDDLSKVIEHLNTNSGSSQPNDPVALVARILSAHMDSLKWVDQNTALLSQKMEDLSKISTDANIRG